MYLDLSDKKILVIDDFSQMRSSMKKMVQSFGATDVDDAANGEDAVKKIARKPYDIVLCDYSLGEGKDGQQVLEESKHRNLVKYSTIFMMITAETSTEMVMGAVEYYPDDYLTKPFTKEVLGKRLEKLIERKSDFDDIESAIHKKQLERAIALCDEHIGKMPKNLLEFFRLKTDLCLKTGAYEQAEAVYEKVLAMRAIPWAVMGMAKVHFHQQQYQKAQEMLRDLLETNDAHVEAYDWLAKCYDKLGEHQQAQEALARAAELSPKSVLRQKALGEIAHKNHDLDAAEKSYSKAIRLGKNSIYKSPHDYANLSKVFVEKDSPSQALKVLGNLQKEYKGDANAGILCHAMEGMAYKKMNRNEEADQAMEAASALYEKAGGKVPLEVTMDVAQAHLTLGNKEKGNAMIKEIVRNHHDDEEILKQIEGIFEDADLEEEGKRIISSTRDEIIGINNKGVTLVKEKKLKEAIDFFDKAADGLPDNKIINMNAAQAIIMQMEQDGSGDKLLYQARQYLDRVQRLEPANMEYQKLAKRYKTLITAK